MTADERIERLVGAFGQTISDLPKSADNDWSCAVYGSEHLIRAKKEALAFSMDEWRDVDELPEIRYEVEEFLLDYICHLADIIDRMEAALETARRWMPCSTCEFNGDFYVCDNDLDVCTYRICDKNLRDMAIGADPEHLKRETPEGRSDRVGTDGQED